MNDRHDSQPRAGEWDGSYLTAVNHWDLAFWPAPEPPTHIGPRPFTRGRIKMLGELPETHFHVLLGTSLTQCLDDAEAATDAFTGAVGQWSAFRTRACFCADPDAPRTEVCGACQDADRAQRTLVMIELFSEPGDWQVFQAGDVEYRLCRAPGPKADCSGKA